MGLFDIFAEVKHNVMNMAASERRQVLHEFICNACFALFTSYGSCSEKKDRALNFRSRELHVLSARCTMYSESQAQFEKWCHATRHGRLNRVLFYFGHSRWAHQRLAAAFQPHPRDHFHHGVARVRPQTGPCHDAQQEALFSQRIHLFHQRASSRPQRIRHIWGELHLIFLEVKFNLHPRLNSSSLLLDG